jgi:MFS family permease
VVAVIAIGSPYERRWQALAVLCLSLLIVNLDNLILNVALPTLARELSATGSQLQWMVDAYVLVFAGLLLTAGAIGDRFGRKRTLYAGFSIFAIGSVGAALSDSADALIAMRVVMGIGGAFIMPSTLSILANIFPPRSDQAIAFWTQLSPSAPQDHSRRAVAGALRMGLGLPGQLADHRRGCGSGQRACSGVARPD